MPAYVILIRDEPVRDPGSFAAYQKLKRSNLSESVEEMVPLGIYGAITVLKRPAPDGVLLPRFPSVADARSWYDSPAYQAALPLRQKAADYRAIIVEGI